MAQHSSASSGYEAQNHHCRRDLPTQNVDFAAMPNFNFEGIPETLIINIALFLVLLAVYVALSRSAWATAKLRNVSVALGNLAGVVTAFYGPPSSPGEAETAVPAPEHAEPKSVTIDSASPELSPANSPVHRTGEPLIVRHDVEHHDIRFLSSGGSAVDIFQSGASNAFSWIFAAFNVKENELRARCGQDAVDLMRFERFLVVLSALLSLISLIGILPVHLTGTLHRSSYFARTTLANSDPHSGLIWIHVTLTILLVPLVFVLIRKYLKLDLYRIWFRPTRLIPYRTLMMCNVPPEAHNAELIRRHFADAYPNIVLERVDFSYDSNRLARNIEARFFVGYCLEWVRAFKRRQPQQQHTMSTAHCPCLCRCNDTVADAEQYYKDTCTEYDRQLESEVASAQRTPARVVFLTFRSHREAAEVRADMGGLTFGHAVHKRSSSVSDKLGIAYWHPRFAPIPQHINWHNLNTGGWKWWVRLFALNAVLVTLLFFFTTPALLLNYLNDSVLHNSPVLSQWLPMVLLMLVSGFIFVMCQQLVSWAGYYSHVHENYVMMRNAFVYRLLVFLILPSLGLTTAKAVYEAMDVEHERQEWLLRRMYRQARQRPLDGGSVGYGNYYYGTNATADAAGDGVNDADGSPPSGVQWECIFLPSSGAFFVNFMITAAFLENIFHLTQFGEFIVYAIRRCWARSDAERSARDAMPRFFAFPAAYASLLAFLAIDIAYAFISPLVTIFGFLFFMLKYMVDKYDMVFRTSSAPAAVAKRDVDLSMGLHTRAVRFVFWMLLIQQLLQMFFAILRGSYWPVPVVLGLLAVVTFALTLYVFFMAKFVDLQQVRVYQDKLAADGSDDGAAVLSEKLRRTSDISIREVPSTNERQPMAKPEVAEGQNEQRIARNPLLNYKDPAFVAYRQLCSTKHILQPYSMERYKGAKVDIPLPVL